MMLYIASDHGGFSLKQTLKDCLDTQGIEYSDLGVESRDSVDYPDYAALVAEKVTQAPENQGILVCGTGIGMSIAANKFPGVRAALVNIMTPIFSFLVDGYLIRISPAKWFRFGYLLPMKGVVIRTDWIKFTLWNHLHRVQNRHSGLEV
jgi:hypothetical protein